MAAHYRVGIVGCGGISRRHGRGYTANPRTEIVAGMDISEEAARKFADEFGFDRIYTDYREMFEKEELDIVSVATWQDVRAEVTIAAAESGVKAVIGEKPMSVSLGEADDMIEACDRNGVKLAIAHQRRFDPDQNEIRRLIADGAIGQPTLVHVISKRDAGLLNMGTHYIDEWRYWLSDPETLWVVGQTSRYTDRWERRTRCEDFCMGLICFEGGTRGLYEGDLPHPDISLPTVTGTEGKIRLTDTGKVLLHRDGSAGWEEITPPPVETDQFQELVDWIEGKISEHRSSGRQAHYTQEIMMAFYESLRIKNIVKMPLTTRESPLAMMIDDGTLPVLEEGRYDLRRPFSDDKRK